MQSDSDKLHNDTYKYIPNMMFLLSNESPGLAEMPGEK